MKQNWTQSKKGNSQRENFNYLTADELLNSEIVLLQQAQLESYPIAIQCLKSHCELPKISSLLNLSPYLDNNNLICVGGRLKDTEISVNCCDQVIMHKRHYATKLIIKSFHEINLHSGREQTLASLRNRYWVPSCRGLIQKVIKECIFRKRRSVKPQPPIMSELPKERIAIGQKPFSNTGVDYFGPLYIKFNKRTRINQATGKRFGVIFTCLTTRAVHLELSGDLSTDSFILALRRFISRRGFVKVLRSDNGTNL